MIKHHDVAGFPFESCWEGCVVHAMERIAARYPEYEEITVEAVTDDDALLARRSRALELARKHVSAAAESGKYQSKLTPSAQLAEELKVARFLLGGYDD
jgi:hypothetical protein